MLNTLDETLPRKRLPRPDKSLLGQYAEQVEGKKHHHGALAHTHPDLIHKVMVHRHDDGPEHSHLDHIRTRGE